MPEEKDVLDRVVALEAELARARKVGRVALAVAVVGLVVAGGAVGWQWLPGRTVRAARFELVDGGGNMRGTWTADAHGSAVVLISPTGRVRLALRSSEAHSTVDLSGPAQGPAQLRMLAGTGGSAVELTDGDSPEKGRGAITLFASGKGPGTSLDLIEREGEEFRSVSLSSSGSRTGLRVGAVGRDSARSASASLDLLSGEGRLTLIGPASDSADKAKPAARSATLVPGGLSLWRRDGGDKSFELGPPPKGP